MSLSDLSSLKLKKLLDFLREYRANFSNDPSWFNGPALNEAVRHVHGRYSKQLSDKLRAIVRHRRLELLNQLDTQAAGADRESLVASKIAKIANIISRNHGQIDFRNFNRAQATKIARKFYNAENANKNRIDYINTFIRSHYDEIENSIKPHTVQVPIFRNNVTVRQAADPDVHHKNAVTTQPSVRCHKTKRFKLNVRL
ncbi:hypothetical protein KQX54_020165 [Cotesia glomerata]|uniref:Uncharacterized protein n=1 Tax=Cotesia glomerata TaxID=32391 RepID=A0AAV7IAF2_COTGL|nr:hypothetical protein KQX54_020165 [Cotesia glomerata]